MSTKNCDNKSFGTIRNNTALKLIKAITEILKRFGTIRNNTALKLNGCYKINVVSFGTIRNNTALKPSTLIWS